MSNNNEKETIVGRISSGLIVIITRDVAGDDVQVQLTLDSARFIRDRLSEYLEQARVTRARELPIRRGTRRKAE